MLAGHFSGLNKTAKLCKLGLGTDFPFAAISSGKRILNNFKYMYIYQLSSK